MNERGREALRQAALKGTRQIRGGLRRFDDGSIGYCAVGILQADFESRGLGEPVFLGVVREYGLGTDEGLICPACNLPMTEFGLILHLNDYHAFDFLTIANKMPDTEPTA